MEEAEVTVDKKVLKTLELKDNHKFVIGTTAEPSETPEAEDASEETPAEDQVLEPAEEETEEIAEEPTEAPESDAEETETEKAEEEGTEDTVKTTVTPEPTEEAEK